MTKEKKNIKGTTKSSATKAKPALKPAKAKLSQPVKVVKEVKVLEKAKVAPVKKIVAKAAKEKKVFTGNTIKITQIGSGAGRIKPQIQTLKGLGLNKMNRTVELQDTPAIRGMINKVKHLIKVFSK